MKSQRCGGFGCFVGATIDSSITLLQLGIENASDPMAPMLTQPKEVNMPLDPACVDHEHGDSWFIR